jgi:imidazoleglycerol-phosphate dehydratase
MSGTRSGARVALAAEGAANVATGLPVLDHLVGELARAGRFRIALEAAPDSTEEAVSAAAAALGTALRDRLRAGAGWAVVPAAEALATAALEVDPEPRLVTNADFSGSRVGCVSNDVASRLLAELARAVGVNLHVRVLEGDDPQHVLAAIFKAVGAALGQACRPAPASDEEEGS